MKEIALLLILSTGLLSNVSYGNSETPPILTFSRQWMESFPPQPVGAPIILYPKFNGGKLTVVEKVNGTAEIYDQCNLKRIIELIERGCFEDNQIKFTIIVRSQFQYDSCKVALEERCGKGIDMIEARKQASLIQKHREELIKEANEAFSHDEPKPIQ